MPHAGRPTSAAPIPVWAYVLGLIGVCAALFASGMLVYSHLTGAVLPGCGSVQSSGGGLDIGASDGPKSSCASNLAHPMGSLGGWKIGLQALMKGQEIPKIQPLDAVWPVSHLGATYFAAALAGWVMIGVTGLRVPRLIAWIARLGLAFSLVYLTTIVIGYVTKKEYCPYCLVSHAGNLLLWASMEIGMMQSRRSAGVIKEVGGTRVLVAGMAAFAMATGALGALEFRHVEEMKAKDAAEAERTKQELAAQAAEAQKRAEQAAKEEKVPWGPNGFTGRYVLGPKQAQVRVVMLTDYQCPDCRFFEGEMFKLLEKYPDKVSLSVMHFPMDKGCNKYVGSTLHANACWAARAAEAAGIIAGSMAALEGTDEAKAANDAFWKMHKWLFSVKGEFTSDELKAKLPELGFKDTDGFIKVMTGGRTEANVKADVDVGEALGLYFTPMMFVNGVEIRGWRTNVGALTQTVEAALAANPPAMDAKNDRPALASQKYFEDWLKEPKKNPASDRTDRTTGPQDAPVDIVVFGDYNEENTKKVDALVRGFMASKPIRYTFRHYPGAKECNPSLPRDFFANGCMTARAAEAAAIAGGSEGFWKMHEFLFQNQQGISAARIKLGAGTLGLDSAKFEQAQADGRVNVAIQNDVMAGQGLGLRQIPTIYVNGKWVERWQREGDNVLERIIDHCAKNKVE